MTRAVIERAARPGTQDSARIDSVFTGFALLVRAGTSAPHTDDNLGDISTTEEQHSTTEEQHSTTATHISSTHSDG